jgi:hypothetical protein
MIAGTPRLSFFAVGLIALVPEREGALQLMRSDHTHSLLLSTYCYLLSTVGSFFSSFT